MEASFWHKRWDEGKIGFHEGQANLLLVEHFAKLNLAKGSRVFLPLCGKTLDVAWLLDQGYRVVGIELSEVAIRELFQALGIEPEKTKLDKLVLYHAKNIELFVGDFFDATAESIGPIDVSYDRAALIAMPAETRAKYASHLMDITNTGLQLLICLEYDQSQMNGPPFSVNELQVKQFYSSNYQVNPIARKNVEGGLKGNTVTESMWLLQKIDNKA